MKSKPITGNPDGRDDDTINRGITGQSLRDTSMNYDPATGMPTGDNDMDEYVNLDHDLPMQENY